MLWALVVAFIGVYYAVPLRRQMIVLQRLRFPTGTATAETINAMFARGKETARKARVLLISAAASGAFVLLAYFVPNVEVRRRWVRALSAWRARASRFDVQRPPLLAAVGASAAVEWGWNLYLNPMLGALRAPFSGPRRSHSPRLAAAGGGMLCGTHVCVSLLVGAVLGWIVLGVPVHFFFAPGPVMDFHGVRCVPHARARHAACGLRLSRPATHALRAAAGSFGSASRS